MKKTISLILLLSLLFTLGACRDGGEKSEYETRHRTISNVYFNTYSAIYTYADTDDTKIEAYAQICDEVLSYYHELFDIYFEYSGVNNIRTVNQNAGKSAVTVDRALVDFLLYCKELYTLTEGKTNVMLGSVLTLWHDAREAAEGDFGYLSPELLPTAQELEAANAHTSIDALIIDEEACTVYIADPEASLDVGAIAKGYTVNILRDRLKAEGADAVALNIGGNIATIGLKPGGESWVTGITNPDKTAEDSLACRLELGEVSLVTSGDYERYFISGDRRYHHIIDPATLMPADYFSSVSIITENSGLADALSTALFCMSYEEGLALAERIGGVEVIWIFDDGTIKHTEGIHMLS